MQYLLGAGIAGVLFTQISTSVRAWRERNRERDGLLRIIFTEVRAHQRSLELVHVLFALAEEGNVKAVEDSRTASRSSVQGMENQAWDGTRVKLAHLLSSQEFATLVGYYQVLSAAKSLTSGDLKDNELRFVVNRVSELAQEVLQVAHSHVPDVADLMWILSLRTKI